VTGNSRLLFFDELHVHDSGDARLLTRLLDHVFARKLTVLATSNYAPDNLLPNPIWHHIFEPGIALIKTHMDVWPLRGPTDYRTVQDDHSRGFAAGTWSTREPAPPPSQLDSLRSHGRSFTVTSADAGHLTATFDQLCRTPCRQWNTCNGPKTSPVGRSQISRRSVPLIPKRSSDSSTSSTSS